MQRWNAWFRRSEIAANLGIAAPRIATSPPEADRRLFVVATPAGPLIGGLLTKGGAVVATVGVVGEPSLAQATTGGLLAAAGVPREHWREVADAVRGAARRSPRVIRHVELPMVSVAVLRSVDGTVGIVVLAPSSNRRVGQVADRLFRDVRQLDRAG